MCLVGLPRDPTDVCSHCRRYSGRSVTLITHLLMVPMLAMPGSGTPNPICLLFMSWAQLYTGTVSTKIFFWNVRSFRLVDTSKCFERICCLHPQNIYIYVYIYIYTLPSRQTCYYCIHIFISARYSFFKSFLICYLKILKIYCPFYRVPVSTVFVTRCLLNSRYRGRDRPVGIVTGFRTGPSRNLVWIPGSRKIFIYSRMYLLQAWGPPSLLFSGYEGVISRA